MTPTQEAITTAIAEGHETCLCSAIKFGDNIFRGHRHGDCIKAMQERYSWSMNRKEIMASGMFDEEGFLTSRNRFVTREEALKIHQDLAIPSADPSGYRPEIMFSEDLY